MKDIEIQKWSDFSGFLESVDVDDWIFRGQNSQAYRLESSFHRAITRNESIFAVSSGFKSVQFDRLFFENQMINKFSQNSHLLLTPGPAPQNDLDILSLLQHFGAPTRLLDFTYSPYIALFFAISGATASGSIHCINHKSLQKQNKKYLSGEILSSEKLLRNLEEIEGVVLVPYEPQYGNLRLLAQQGLFLVPNSLNFTHEEILESYDVQIEYVRMTFGASFLRDAIRKLHAMNINAYTIFTGLEGFSRSFEFLGNNPLNRLRKGRQKEA